MSATLKPCPFCNGTHITDRHVRDGRQMFCQSCGASVAPTYNGPNNDTLQRAIAAWNRRADGWQSIESAPKDGTTIILARFGEGYVEVSDGSWNQYPKHGEDGLNGFNAYLSNPTHWQPLPSAPAEAS